MNNYTKVPNELFDNILRIRIPGQARQVFDVIVRSTLGWSKTWDQISLSQFSKKTDMKKPNVCRNLNVLVSMNLIFRRGSSQSKFSKTGNDISTEYRVNVDFETWRPLERKKSNKNIATRAAKIIPIEKNEQRPQTAQKMEPVSKAAAPPPSQEEHRPGAASVKDDFKEEIIGVARQIYGLNNGKKFNVNRWVGKHLKRNSHPGAILKTLISIRGNWNGIRDPEAYAERIMSIEGGNFHERDAIRESEELAGGFKTLEGIFRQAGIVPGARAP